MRISLQTKHLAQIAGVLALLTLAWGQAPAAGAAAFTSGQLAISTTSVRTGAPLAAAPLFTATLVPGQTVTESVVVRNTGDLAFAVKLATSLDKPIAEAGSLWDPTDGLQAEVRLADGSTVFRGPLGAINTNLPVKLAAGEESVVSIAVTLPANRPAAPTSGSAALAISFRADQLI